MSTTADYTQEYLHMQEYLQSVETTSFSFYDISFCCCLSFKEKKKSFVLFYYVFNFF